MASTNISSASAIESGLEVQNLQSVKSSMCASASACCPGVQLACTATIAAFNSSTNLDCSASNAPGGAACGSTLKGSAEGGLPATTAKVAAFPAAESWLLSMLRGRIYLYYYW